VAQRVEREPAGGGDACAFDGLAEALADIAVVEAPAEHVGEDEGVRALVRGGEPAFAQELRDRGGEDDLPPTCLGLERRVLALAGELAVDADQPGVEVDVGPVQAERFADTQPGVGEELKQRSARSGVGQEAGELLAFKDRDLLRGPVGLLARFEPADRFLGQPATADGEAADLVERDQDDTRRGRRERALVRLRLSCERSTLARLVRTFQTLATTPSG
jgi:hypothetical protein